MKYFVVSDVHGFYTPLIQALNAKGFNPDNPEHMLIVCGDLMDRGDEAIQLQEYIVQLMDRNKVILVRGNHEDLILEMADDFKNGSVASYHITNGTLSTAIQLCGIKSPIDENFAQKLLDTPFCSKIIGATKNYFETPHYIFVHGWIPCKTQSDMPSHYRHGRTYTYDPSWRSANKDDWATARWFNGMELSHKHKIIEPNKTIVCGHWNCSFGWSHYKQDRKEFPTSQKEKIESFQPYYDTGIIAIDACTAYSGFVNCIVLED